jgi:hypothetical protein
MKYKMKKSRQLEIYLQWISQQLTETEPYNISVQPLELLEILEHDYMSESERIPPRESQWIYHHIAPHLCQ